MAKPRGRRPYKAPDGVETQPPYQTARANASPRQVKKRNIYDDMRLQQKRQYSKVKPGYGPTGHFA